MIAKKINELTNHYKAILDFLNQWQDEFHLYDLMDLHSTEYYFPLEEFKFLKEYWDTDLTPYFNDQFISFAVDGAGGYYCFWLYPNLKTEAAIVFFDGHGEQYFLASNLNDFVCRMINELDFCGGWLCEGDDVMEAFNEKLWRLVDRSQEEFKKEISEEQVGVLFEKEREVFKEKASEFITLKSEKAIKNDFKKHPNFDNWIKQVEEKNNEIYKEKQQPKTLIPQEKIQGFDSWIKDRLLSKVEIINLIKNTNTKLYNTQEFQEWIKK